MQGLGEKIRARARAISLSDAEVARRLELTPSRFGRYVRDDREPDIGLLLRICAVLGCTPTDLLIGLDAQQSREAILAARCVSALAVLDIAQAELVVSMVEAAAAAALKA